MAIYSLLSAFCGVFLSIAYFRGYEFPKRLRRYGATRLFHSAGGEGGGGRGGGGGYGYNAGMSSGGYPPGYGGYGTGSGWGKKD